MEQKKSAPSRHTLSRRELVDLIPTSGLRPRRERYIGDTVVAELRELRGNDVAILRDLYVFLGHLERFTASLTGSPSAAAMAATTEFLAEQRFSALCNRLPNLGAALRDQNTPQRVRRVLHDIRGGSLTALVAHLDLIELDMAVPADLDRLPILARDHRKIMRNALPELDADGYSGDLSHKQHTVALIANKWSNVDYRTPESHARVAVDCAFAGSVSDCCMEFAALDRVIYNLISNAARYASDEAIDLMIVPIEQDGAIHVRFAVINAITDEHRTRLEERFGGDIRSLFEGGFTTGGHGLGMRICGDIVTHGYGLDSLQTALDHGYLGARLVADCFVAWFHWPGQDVSTSAAAAA
ncbi:MAG: ATP-binding protein [Myxococcota bacterium]